MNKRQDKIKVIRISHMREWMATFVYMCPWHEGDVGGAYERCMHGHDNILQWRLHTSKGFLRHLYKVR